MTKKIQRGGGRHFPRKRLTLRTKQILRKDMVRILNTGSTRVNVIRSLCTERLPKFELKGKETTMLGKDKKRKVPYKNAG